MTDENSNFIDLLKRTEQAREEIKQSSDNMRAIFQQLGYWPVFRDRDSVLWFPRITDRPEDPRHAIYNPLFKIETDGLAHAWSDGSDNWSRKKGLDYTSASRLPLDRGPLTEVSATDVAMLLSRVLDQIMPLRIADMTVQWAAPRDDLPYAVIDDADDAVIWTRDEGADTYSLYAVGMYGFDGPELDYIHAASPKLYHGFPHRSPKPSDAHRPLSAISYTRQLHTRAELAQFERDYR